MPICAPGMPGISKVGICGAALSCTLISISRSSSVPSRSILRNFCRVSAPALVPTSASSTRSSAASSAFGGRPRLEQPLAGHGDRDLDEIARDLLDVAADIADLGEFCRLDLEERRLRQPGQATGDLGLAAAGRADHQDVLRRYLLAQLGGQLLAPPAIAQGDRHGALGVVLADDKAVELGNNFARAESGHAAGDIGIRRCKPVPVGARMMHCWGCPISSKGL